MRGETSVPAQNTALHQYFNPLPSCEGRLGVTTNQQMIAAISIHSPHARGDVTRWATASSTRISIHSPHARGDHIHNTSLARFFKFQSTPLMRGETTPTTSSFGRKRFQSTPLMRGETFNVVISVPSTVISIHSPHARGDWRMMFVPVKFW